MQSDRIACAPNASAVDKEGGVIAHFAPIKMAMPMTDGYSGMRHYFLSVLYCSEEPHVPLRSMHACDSCSLLKQWKKERKINPRPTTNWTLVRIPNRIVPGMNAV